MDHLHHMVLHDKILMCEIVLGLGLLSGALARVVAIVSQRRTAQSG